MKSNLKVVFGLGLFAILASCSQSYINVETAKERAKGIIAWQEEHVDEIGINGIEVTTVIEEIYDENYTKINFVYYSDVKNDIERFKIDINYNSESKKNVHVDLYMGEIDGEFYYAEVNNKIYTKSVLEFLNIVYSEYPDVMEMYTDYTHTLEPFINASITLGRFDWTSEAMEDYKFKSKDDGHIGLFYEYENVEENSHFTRKVSIKETYEFDNYLFKSMSSVTTRKMKIDGGTSITKYSAKMKVKWNCTLSMPSLDKYTEHK